MQLPKMILFDAGRTLVNYGETPTTLEAFQHITPYITYNPNNWTSEDMERKCNEIFDCLDGCREAQLEVPEQTGLKLLFDILDISFSIPIDEIERIYANHFIDVYTIDRAAEFLDYISLRGIRTGVISNFVFSGSRLRERLKKLYPNHHFEFVIASSDYGVRKPNKLLFEVGITKSRVKPGEIWYIGDKVNIDVVGSAGSGMIPVFYHNPRNNPQAVPDDVLAVDSYKDLIEILEKAR